MVTSKDVAREAGVSQASVSRVLNDSPLVTDALRERVLAAVARTGFSLNSQAQAMRTRRSGAIGLLTSDIRNPYFPLLLDELTRAANDRGVRTIVWDDRTSDGRDAVRGLASGAVDGLILTSVRMPLDDVHAVSQLGAPYVFCNRAPEDADADVVMADHEALVYTATSHVLSLGRTELGAIFGSQDSVATPLRRRGFDRALEQCGIEVPPTHIRNGETTYEGGFRCASEMWDDGCGVSTLVCGSDVIAWGAIDALRTRGIRVPEDVWVVGADGLPQSGWAAFDLTTVAQDIPRIAQRSVERLLARINGDTQPPQREIVPAELVVRGSTAGR